MTVVVPKMWVYQMFLFSFFFDQVKLPGEWDQNPDRLLLEWGGVRPSYGDQFKADFGPDARS